MIELVVDSREHAMITLVRSIPAITRTIKGIAHTIQVREQTLSAGDYAVTIDGALMAVVERKTLEDYAASIKDRRADNKRFMKDARDKSRCDLYYVIEEAPNGAKFADLEAAVFAGHPRSVNGIPGASIITSITNLTTRDKIFTTITPSLNATFIRLINIAFGYAATHGSLVHNAAQTTFAIIAGDRKLADDEILRQMFTTLPHIHEQNVSLLAGYTLTRAIELPPPTLPTRARTALQSVPAGGWVNMLSVIPGITERYLSALRTVSYHDMLDLTPATRARILLALEQKMSSRLEQIHRLMTQTVI